MQRQSSPVERWTSFRGSGQSRRTPVPRSVSTRRPTVQGVIMRGCALGGQRRTSVRAFGAAGMTSLTIQDPNGACGNRRSGVLGRRSRFAARPLRWSDLDRLLELADGPAAGQISIPEPALYV